MQVIVFGGTGSVGRFVVDQALEAGHHVALFTRDRSAVSRRHDRLDVVEGSVFDAVAVREAIVGNDAVIVTLGAGSKGGVRARGTDTITGAMREVGVTRIIVQSTLGVGESWANLNFVWKRLMFGMILREVYADHVEQERVTRESGLDWTIARPGAFTDGPRTGTYRRGFGPTPQRKTPKIARADVADFVVSQLTDDTWMHQTPGLANA